MIILINLYTICDEFLSESHICKLRTNFSLSLYRPLYIPNVND